MDGLLGSTVSRYGSVGLAKNDARMQFPRNFVLYSKKSTLKIVNIDHGPTKSARENGTIHQSYS